MTWVSKNPLAEVSMSLRYWRNSSGFSFQAALCSSECLVTLPAGANSEKNSGVIHVGDRWNDVRCLTTAQYISTTLSRSQSQPTLLQLWDYLNGGRA